MRIGFNVSKVLKHVKSKYQKITVFQNSELGKILMLDNYVMWVEKFEYCYHEMITHVPLYQHKNPQSLLIIGGGDLGSLKEALKHENLARIDLCEIDEKVVNVAKEFLYKGQRFVANKRVKFYFKGGMEYLKNSKNRYDVIIVDGCDPIGSASELYSNEFYALASEALKKHGIFCTLSGSPFLSYNLMRQNIKRIRKQFKFAKHYLSYVPMYMTGCWGFLIASNEDMLRSNDIKNPSNVSSKKLRYYNRDIHRSCFSLPNIFQKL